MSKYVDVEKILNDKGRATRFPKTSDLYYHESVLQYAPAEDVAPVIHAHWIAIGIDCDMPTCFRCSICRQHTTRTSEFCPNCGAKMDEEVKQ